MKTVRIFFATLQKHPLGALYAVLLGFIALLAARPLAASGAWEAALVDLIMGGILIAVMLKNLFACSGRSVSPNEKLLAWSVLLFANILALLPTQNLLGPLSTAFAFTLLICAFVLYFSGGYPGFCCLVPALWCCVFMPFHEEIMLFLSYPLRLSATMFSGFLLQCCGIEAVFSGTSLSLPELEIAITDACSGINQLDAFLLIAFIIVRKFHKNPVWQVFHFAFIIPAIIAGNTLRIVLTVLLYKLLGESVLMNTWHTGLGFVQIVLALLFFYLVGKLFVFPPKNETGEKEQ